MSRLEINQGETYTVAQETQEEYTGADVNGTLDITDSGSSLWLYDEATPNTSQPGPSPISLPLEIDFTDMNVGNALFLTLTMGLLLGAVAFLKNYAAGIMLMLAVFTLVVSGLLGMGLEVFWAMIAATVILLIVGMVVRWST